MMKKVILFVFATYLFSSCSQNEYDENKTNKNYVPLSIAGVSIGRDKVIEKVGTRAALVGDIGISRLATGVYTAQSNIKYTYNSNAWTPPSSTNQIFVGSDATTLFAYTPYSASYTGEVSMSSGLYAAANDFCYGYATGVTADIVGNGVSFTLNHAYSKLTLRLSKDAYYDGSGNITDIKIEGATNAGTLTFSGTTATMSALTASEVNLTGSPITTLPGVAGTTVDVTLLMVPTTLFADLTLSIVVDGNIKAVTVPKTSLPSLVAGNNYTLRAVVSKKDVLDIPNSGNVITSQDWDNTSNTNSVFNESFTPQPESNCYMVKPGSTIYIPVSRAVRGNAAIGYVATGGGTTAFSTGDSFTAGVLWSDVAITDRTATVVNDNFIKVTAGATEGNFVAYAMKGTSIVWSWHIWVSNYIASATAKPTAPTVTSGTGTIPNYGSQYWMDRNLGATTSAGNSQTSLGLYYQWGRKDPFPAASGVSASTGQTIYLPQSITYPAGAASITGFNTNVCYIGSTTTPLSLANQSSYAIQYPLMFLTGWAGSTASAVADGTTAAGGMYSWNTGTNTKSIFDPCPVGWRVPSNTSYATSPWNSFGTAANTYSGASWSATFFGASVTTPAAAATFYPATGFLYSVSGGLYEVGTSGLNWSCSVNGYDVASSLYFTSSVFHAASNYNNRSFGFSVRCVQE